MQQPMIVSLQQGGDYQISVPNTQSEHSCKRAFIEGDAGHNKCNRHAANGTCMRRHNAF